MTTEQPMTPGTRQYLTRARAEIAAQGGVCRCGAQVLVGWIGDVEDNCRVAVCRTGDHVMVVQSALDAKVYVHVENPEDVIVHTVGHADACARRQIGTVSPDPECDCGVGDA